jgi:uncharacterized delta-60 repeat protein
LIKYIYEIKITLAFTLISSFAFSQYGNLDESFNDNGYTIADLSLSDQYGTSVAIQPDGKILVAGDAGNWTEETYDLVLLRYNEDGSADASFNEDGILIADITDGNEIVQHVLIQPDGKIVVSGYAMFDDGSFVNILTCFTSDGAYDNTFDSGGILLISGANTTGIHIALQGDGKLLAVERYA